MRESSDHLTQGEGEEADVIGGDYRILSEMREALQVELHGLKSYRNFSQGWRLMLGTWRKSV